jgi:hypothetical protein
VAQIYHDLLLAGPGDLILSSDRSPAGEIFVEPWNSYTLRSKDLNPAITKVDRTIVEALRTLAAYPTGYPDWAEHPRPMEENDPRIFFREMEIEVGYTFSSVSVSSLIQELERPPLLLVYRTVKETLDDLRQKNPGITWPVEPETVEEVLATVQFPAELYAMAAATDNRELFKANLVTIRSDRVNAVAPIEGEIFQKETAPEGLIIGGRVLLPRGMVVSKILCFLEERSGYLISPESESLRWDSEGFFHAVFPASTPITGRFFLAVIREAPHE